MKNLTTKKLPQLKKIKSNSSGKDVYFIGRKDGVYYWLEAANWSFGWYWSFGYIQTYTNNKRPDLSKDINSIHHWNSFIIGKHEIYSPEKECFILDNTYIHHSNQFFGRKNSPLSDTESWKLAELMSSFYALKETAEVLGRGGSHVSPNPCSDIIKNETEVKRINEIVLPAIFIEVYKLLTP